MSINATKKTLGTPPRSGPEQISKRFPKVIVPVFKFETYLSLNTKMHGSYRKKVTKTYLMQKKNSYIKRF